MAVVRRYRLDLADTGDADSRGHQLRSDGNTLLGNRYRRLRHHAGADGRVVRALVPVRRVLSAVPGAWPHLETAPAVGMEHRRVRARGIRWTAALARHASRQEGAAPS